LLFSHFLLGNQLDTRLSHNRHHRIHRSSASSLQLNETSPYGDLVEKIKTNIILDENDLDLERCHDKWMVAYWGLLERNNMMSFHEKHPKKAVEALVHGIRSLASKQLVRTSLNLDHKHLRNSVLSSLTSSRKRCGPPRARAGRRPSGLVKVEPKRSDSSPAEASGTGCQRQLRPTSQAVGWKKDPRGQKPWTKASRPDDAGGAARGN
jgi:hypothetical protein